MDEIGSSLVTTHGASTARVIAAAIIAAALIVSGVIAYLSRYKIEAATRTGGGAKYLLHDRWTGQLSNCTRTESFFDEKTDPAETKCEAWTPITGGKP